jgi:glycosyltransferase involved in cell wall biosynthesis
MTPGLVSTVIPVHDRPQLLRESVASVLRQSHETVEAIIVDDGSSDHTPEVARDLATLHPSRVRVLHQARGGPGAARQAGLELARGEFVQFLDSDDLLMPGKFTADLAAFAATPDAEICYGGTRRYRAGDDPGPARPQDFIRATGSRFDTLYPRILTGRLWATGSALFRRSLLQRAGPWVALDADEDWLFELQLGLCGARLCHVAGHVCDIRDHAGAQLHRDRQRQRWQHRAQARLRMLELLGDHGVDPSSAELQHFTRSTFLLTRQCAAIGLADESRMLLLALLELGALRGRLRVYRALARCLGEQRLGRLCADLDALRDRCRGAAAASPPRGGSGAAEAGR